MQTFEEFMVAWSNAHHNTKKIRLCTNSTVFATDYVKSKMYIEFMLHDQGTALVHLNDIKEIV